MLPRDTIQRDISCVSMIHREIFILYRSRLSLMMMALLVEWLLYLSLVVFASVFEI
jgi:hypothetical protein